MSKQVIMIDDFPNGNGGAEKVNRTVADKLEIDIVESHSITEFDDDVVYIVSNISLMPFDVIEKLSSHPHYIILEHDYKFVASRHPWRYPRSRVPKEEIINRKLYKNAKAVFVQTDDHKEVFTLNCIAGNFISLKSSIWSDYELDALEDIGNVYESDCLTAYTRSTCAAIINSDNWIKNTQGATSFAIRNHMEFALIEPIEDYRQFLLALGAYSTLIFIPLARESCCRLLVEAKALGLNTITTDNSGAAKSTWFRLPRVHLIKYLRSQSASGIQMIRRYLV